MFPYDSFNKTEISLFRKLNTPAKIQDFLDTIPIVGAGGKACFSPRMVLQKRKAHCLEGAMFAAAALRFHKYPPLLVDLEAHHDDVDHVIAVFKQRGHWGAISKTNYPTLRYRDPIYKSIRELVMSYFNEYFLDDGEKTLHAYSRPVNLARFDRQNWMTAPTSVWFIEEYLDKIPHQPIMTKAMRKNLRKTDQFERKSNQMRQWK
jgi:hypothetical protein